LPHYDGDTSGLCPPAESTLCDCPGEFGTQGSVDAECTPDGTACINFHAQCEGVYPPTWECGWLAGRPEELACPELRVAAVEDEGIWGPCASDRDCLEGHYCTLRIANRMFCDNTYVARAEELCGGGGASGGGGAAGSD
jgi:hypothetical protein